MNSTEQKIRDAFEKSYGDNAKDVLFWAFREGYMALLNELVSVGYRNAPWDLTVLYRLPEGVEKP